MTLSFLKFFAQRSGPELYVIVAVVGALAFGLGGESIGVIATFGVIAAVIALGTTPNRLELDVPTLEPGLIECSACRGGFAPDSVRKLSKWLAFLGPATYAARQNSYCRPCARRQEIFAGLLVLVLVGFTAAYVVTLL